MLACGMGTERMKFDWTQGALAEGLRLYDAGEFFAAHEAWESVWLRAQQPEKTFLQGLIQVTAAFHHLQRNNPQGTALLLQAALGRLEHYPARFGDISVTVLCDDIRAWLQALEADAPASQLGPESRKRPAIGPPLHSSLAESITDGCTND
jgi:predicted metal-dependent hydrolase